MCNACGNVCCGSDMFGGCGCDDCECEECWRPEPEDDEYDEFDYYDNDPAREGDCVTRQDCTPSELKQVLAAALTKAKE